VVLSLGLGIGANTAIFSLIDAVMLRMLPVRDPQQLYLVGSTDGGPPVTAGRTGQYRMLRDDAPAFASLAAYSQVRLSVSVDGGLEPTAAGQLVSGNYFATLGVSAAAGRTLSEEDDRVPDGHPVAMLGHGYWKRRFGQDPRAVGSTLVIGGRPFTVIGVTPAEFFGVEVGSSPDIYVPLMMQPTVMPASENWLANPALTAYWLRALGRLRPGVGARRRPRPTSTRCCSARSRNPGRKPARAARRCRTSAWCWSRRHGALGAAQSVLAVALHPDEHRGAGARDRVRQRRQPAAGAGGGARTGVRRAAVARRGRLRLTRQLLMESVLLAGLGGVVRHRVLPLGRRAAVGVPVRRPRPDRARAGPGPSRAGLHGCGFAADRVFFGLVPALRAGRIDPGAALKGRPGGGRIGVRPGRALVVSQVASCVLLLFGAGLFVRSLQKLDGQDTGFDRERVLMLRVEPRGSDQRGIPGTPARLDRTYRELLQRVEAIPGVRSASLAHFTPTSRIGFSSPLRLPSGEEASVGRLMVYPKYFATMGIPIVAGRDFGEADTREDSPLVAVVNEAFVRKLFPGQSAVGQQYLTRAHRRQQAAPCEIIGVVRDTRYASLRGETPPVIYEPFFQTTPAAARWCCTYAPMRSRPPSLRASERRCSGSTARCRSTRCARWPRRWTPCWCASA
jgi:hypothetical protein